MDILNLYETMKRTMAELTRSQYAIHALDWIFERPIFKSSDFIAAAGIPADTAKRMLPSLRDAGVLKFMVAASGRRASVLCFPGLLNFSLTNASIDTKRAVCFTFAPALDRFLLVRCLKKG